jgi:hypothetical protein
VPLKLVAPPREPPREGDLLTQDLRRRFVIAMERIVNSGSDVLDDVAEHPRHNEKVGRLERVIEFLELLATLLEWLATTNVPHPNSIFLRPRRGR